MKNDYVVRESKIIMKMFIVIFGLIIIESVCCAAGEHIYISDASFDDNVIPDGTYTNDVIYNPDASEYPNQAPHGENVCRIRQGGGWGSFYDHSPVDISTDHNIISNSTYVLEVNVGIPDRDTTDFRVELWAGTNLLKSTNWGTTKWGYINTPQTGGFLTITIPVYIPNNHPSTGSQFMIRLSVEPKPGYYDGIAVADFDNMRLARYVGGPLTSLKAADSNFMQISASNLITNITYRCEMVDTLDMPNQIIWSNIFYSDSTTNTLTIPVIGNQGFMQMWPYVP